ncbi:hypothetical protein SAMN05421837_104212 [Amycolatopsis pretoriensis]|uniref:Uncharacterized protein n=1 Tax=Amycolatopsis pretoriensis TaxID=218821 RepID=A0A1H5QQX2_9PSEU|nr:hypothetical protein [Amycolatopsis pretoriensis]SEF28552.1 hypothetical protein SAMN05421837_104212 [Amycolatopsis pretoriensis]
MGKHSRRKSGYLPKVAAPVALLFAAPATAFAAPADLALPLEHRHSTTLDNDGDTLSASRRDFVGKQLGDVRLAADRTEAVATRGDRAGAVERARHGVWLGNGVDVLSENAEQLDAGLFTGDLTGGAALRRSSGQAVDLGRLGAVGTTSEVHAIGSFAGDLEAGQTHELGGQLGPASGLVKTTAGSFSGDLGVDHVVHVQGGTTSLRGTLTASVLDQRVL